MTIAAEEIDAGVQVVIDARIAFIGLVGAPWKQLIVLAVASTVDGRQIPENTLRKRRDLVLRNDAIRVDLTGVGIPDRYAEDALALVLSGKIRDLGSLRDSPITFVIGEKEDLVPDHRSAPRTTELVLNQSGLLVVQRLEESYCVQIGISQELPGGAVEGVRSAFDCRVDDGSAGPAVLGAVVVGLEPELLQRIGRKLDHLV